jgi:hypothetical protein
MKTAIKELTIINELALTIGLIMLTIGNFLEANGRMNLGVDIGDGILKKPGLYFYFGICLCTSHASSSWSKRNMGFNFASVVAFSSIMMTYFGVNFYLVGLHSYASGDQVITPSFIYYTQLECFC